MYSTGNDHQFLVNSEKQNQGETVIDHSFLHGDACMNDALPHGSYPHNPVSIQFPLYTPSLPSGQYCVLLSSGQLLEALASLCSSQSCIGWPGPSARSLYLKTGSYYVMGGIMSKSIMSIR